jgi:hypothetical protein
MAEAGLWTKARFTTMFEEKRIIYHKSVYMSGSVTQDVLLFRLCRWGYDRVRRLLGSLDGALTWGTLLPYKG